MAIRGTYYGKNGSTYIVDGKEITTMAARKAKETANTGMRILTDTEVDNVINPDSESFDPIARPVHYCGGRKYEPRKVIEDWDLDFYLGNAVKYISRAGRKGPAIDDLQKAVQYLYFEIEKLQSKEKEDE